MRNFDRKSGLSLLEVVVAALIFALAIIPIYYALSSQSVSDLETTKIAMAKDILTSLRQEIMARPFDELSPYVPATKGPLQNEPYPLTLDKILKAQKEYQGIQFELSVDAELTGPGKKVIQFEGKVTWKDNKNQIKEETLSFMTVNAK